MAWVKLDDQFPDHPKVVQAGPLAGWLYVCGLAYCARYLTDGFIPAGQVRKLADVDDVTPLVTALVTAGLWRECDGGYEVHDYLDYNPPAEKVRAEREANARRQARFRNRTRNLEPDATATDTRNSASNAVTNGGSSPVPSPSPSPIVSLVSNDPKETSGAGAPKPSKKRVRRVYEPESDYYRLAVMLGKRITANVPQAGEPTEQQLQQWADVARLMIERDKRTLTEVARVLKWSQSHRFWHRHILSMQKLREKYLQLCADMNAEADNGPSNPPATHRAPGAPASRGAHRGQHTAGPAEDYDAFVGLTGNGR